MSTIKNLTIVAILLGAAYYAFVNRNKLIRFFDKEMDKRPKRRVNNADDVMTDVCQAFLMYADNFQGLFEPMYKTSIGIISYERKMNVFLEWDIRMGNISQAPVCLRSWWSTIIANYHDLADNDIAERAQRVIQMILNSGIIRDDQTEIVAAKDTEMYYQHANGYKWNVGQNLRVESPCWFMRSNPIRIIEKGYCEFFNK